MINARFSRAFIWPLSKSPRITPHCRDEGDVMERRHFLKLAFGFAAGAVALAASAAEAAPLAPQPLTEDGCRRLETLMRARRSRPATRSIALRPKRCTGAASHGRWGRRVGVGVAAAASLGLASPPLPPSPPSLLAPPLLVRRDRSSSREGGNLRPPVSTRRKAAAVMASPPTKKPRASGVFAVMRDVKLSNGSVRHTRRMPRGQTRARGTTTTGARGTRPADAPRRPRRDWITHPP